jgi:sec-independent protein translocase protein TatA
MTGRFGELLLILLIILLLFGAGKLPRVMGEIARGIRSFKDNISAKDDASDKSDEDKKDH